MPLSPCVYTSSFWCMSMRAQVPMTCSSDAGAAQHILDPLLAAVEGELPSLRRSGRRGRVGRAPVQGRFRVLLV